MEGKGVDQMRSIAGPESGQAVDRSGQQELTQLLAASVEAVGCTDKEAAISQGIDPAHWSRIKSGEKAAHLDRVARLPESVQKEFVKRYARQLRMDVREEDAQRAAVVDLAEAAVRVLKVIA